jgi:hypothetical protein
MNGKSMSGNTLTVELAGKGRSGGDRRGGRGGDDRFDRRRNF